MTFLCVVSYITQLANSKTGGGKELVEILLTSCSPDAKLTVVKLTATVAVKIAFFILVTF